MHSSKQIISFDGNVYTGKTSIINSLSEIIDINVICEYSNYFNEIDFRGLSPSEIQSKYLNVEYIRSSKINNNKINILDRSIISQAAHIWISYKINEYDLRSEFISTIKNSKKIIIPDLSIFIRCEFDKSKKRFLNGESSKNKKDTNNNLINQEYYELFNQFMIQFANITIDTTNSSLKESAKEVLEIIKSDKKSDTINIIDKINKIFFE